MEWVPFAVVMLVINETMTTQQILLVAVLVNVDNIETKGIGIVSSIVRACDTHVSHQSRTDDLDLAKIPRPTRHVPVTKLPLKSTLLQRHRKIFEARVLKRKANSSAGV